MPEHADHSSDKAGLAPGTLVHVGGKWARARRALRCLLVFLIILGCSRERVHDLDEGRYSLSWKGTSPGGTQAREEADAVDLEWAGERVLLRWVADLKLPALTPPEMRRSVQELMATPVEGKLVGNGFTCSFTQGEVTNELAGKLVADSRMAGTFTARKADGTLLAEGTWTLAPAAE